MTTLDPALLREAQEVMRLYSSPAQALIKQNLYGPREVRFAGALIAKCFTVVVAAPLPKPEKRLRDLQKQAHETVTTLCALLQRAVTVIETSVAGQASLIQECEDEIACAEDNIFPPDSIDDDDAPATKATPV